MADEVEMTPVEGAEPPKADTLAKIARGTTVKLSPVARPGLKLPTQTALKPGLKLPPKPGATVSTLRPGLKLPPKPGATVSALRPGLKLPAKPAAPTVAAAAAPAATAAAASVAVSAPAAASTGLKLPPKPGATVSALRPGLKLPTQSALKPGIKLPAKPVIRKPGTASAMALPKPVVKTSATGTAEVAKPVAAPATAAAAPAAPVVAELQPVELPKPMEQLKSVTSKLKGLTQEIPQQAILRKTGIIADGTMSEAQKEAAKHKTSRISLSDALGVAPVKNEAAPMKTIRIKRPTDIASPTAPLAPLQRPVEPAAPASQESALAATVAETAVKPAVSGATMTQRKTLKIARPGGTAVRPSGKFGVKRPASQATTVAKVVPDASAGEAAPAADAVSDIPDIPALPAASVQVAAPVSDGPAWLWTLSAVVQLAACAAIGALAWFLYDNTQTAYF